MNEIRREIIVTHNGELVDAMRLRVDSLEIPLEQPLVRGDELDVQITVKVKSVDHVRHKTGLVVRAHYAKVLSGEIVSGFRESFDDFPVSVAHSASDNLPATIGP